jgi:hypothetical protein
LGATVYVDIGDLGAGSDLTWHVLATVNYRTNSRLKLRVGYRHMQIEQRRRGTEFDIGLGGPIIAATLRF